MVHVANIVTGVGVNAPSRTFTPGSVTGASIVATELHSNVLYVS